MIPICIDKIRAVRGLFLLAVLAFSLNLRAQLNESDTLRFQLRISLSGSYQTGNVELLIVRSRAEMLLSFGDALKLKTQNNTLFQTFGGRTADNDLSSRNFLYFRPEKQIYPFAMIFVQRNLRRKVDHRTFAGTGLTWQVARRANGYLKLSASMVYEQTRFSTSSFNETFYNGNIQISIWRPTFYTMAGLNNPSGNLKIYGVAYWQPGLHKVNNNRMQAEFGADVGILKGLSFTMLYLNSFEQVVSDKVRQHDGLFTFGLNYQFKKQPRK